MTLICKRCIRCDEQCTFFFSTPHESLFPFLRLSLIGSTSSPQVDSILAQVPDLRDPLSYYSQSDDRFWVAVSGQEVAGSVAVKVDADGVAEIKRMQVAGQ